MPPWLIITGSIVLGVLVLVTAARLLKLHVRHKLMSEINARYHGRTVLCQALGANFFGQSSKSLVQLRGNGALVLTREELYFRMIVPKRHWCIPLTAIRKVSLVKSHRGRAVLTDLIKIDYLSDRGEDAVAWAVRDPEHWRDEIMQAVAAAKQEKTS